MADDFVSNSLVLPSGLHHRDGTTGWPWCVEDQLPSDRPSDRRLLHAFLLGKSRGVVSKKIKNYVGLEKNEHNPSDRRRRKT